MEEVMFSRGPNGEAKFEYVLGDGGRTLLIEPIKEGILETLFDGEGGVLKQVAIKGNAEALEDEVEGVLKRADRVGRTAYREIILKKKCPHCGAAELKRVNDVNDEVTKVPIMPTYACDSCGNKSYYLTDAHLVNMVHENRDMFSGEELKELEGNEEEFLKELKGYIIRIFASKKIIAIK